MKKYLIQAIQVLATNNRIFCSEADFQFSLAWQLKSLLPKANVFLEFATPVNNYYVDIVVEYSNKYYFIELKYQTDSCQYSNFGFTASLKKQAAQDLMRYDYLKDIDRLYNIRRNHNRFGGGYAVILSNDSLMYKAPDGKKNTLDSNFRIHDRRGIKPDPYPVPGNVQWNNSLKESDHWTKTGSRKHSFVLPPINTDWQPYLSFIDDANKEQVFKYLINEVKPSSSLPTSTTTDDGLIATATLE